jgi:hypothetical protein
MESVVEQLNATIGDSKGVFLDLVRWETHAWPGFGADAQDVINREIEPGDIFVGVLWRRIGTPTQRAISGTVEEFDRAYKLWLNTGRPSLMVYFSKAAFYPSREDLDQFRGVLDFQDRLREKGAFVWEYDGPGQFGDLVHTHLYKEVERQLLSPSHKLDDDPSVRLVLGVLEGSRNVGQGYRTLSGLAGATGLSRTEVEHVIKAHPQLVVRSTKPDAKGNALFKLRA